jgi:hypothetical protein
MTVSVPHPFFAQGDTNLLTSNATGCYSINKLEVTNNLHYLAICRS